MGQIEAQPFRDLLLSCRSIRDDDVHGDACEDHAVALLDRRAHLPKLTVGAVAAAFSPSSAKFGFVL